MFEYVLHFSHMSDADALLSLSLQRHVSKTELNREMGGQICVGAAMVMGSGTGWGGLATVACVPM